MTPALRAKVIARDLELAERAGVVFCCPVEGCEFEFALGAEDPNIEADHVTPKSAGGTDDLENLRVVCRRATGPSATLPCPCPTEKTCLARSCALAGSTSS